MRLTLLLLAVSVIITGVSLVLGFQFFFLLLFVPLVPLFRRPPAVRRCPVCGWETAGSERFCPYDGTELAPQGRER